MGTGGTTRAWGDCPECDGVGLIAVVTYAPTDHEMLDDPCPTCTAHFKAVDEARAQGAAEATERAAKVVGQEVQKWYDWAEEARGDEDMELRMTGGYDACVGVAAAIRAAGDTVKGGTSDGK